MEYYFEDSLEKRKFLARKRTKEKMCKKKEVLSLIHWLIESTPSNCLDWLGAVLSECDIILDWRPNFPISRMDLMIDLRSEDSSQRALIEEKWNDGLAESFKEEGDERFTRKGWKDLGDDLTGVVRFITFNVSSKEENDEFISALQERFEMVGLSPNPMGLEVTRNGKLRLVEVKDVKNYEHHEINVSREEPAIA